MSIFKIILNILAILCDIGTLIAVITLIKRI